MIEAPPRARELQGRRYVWRVAEHLDSSITEQVPGVSRMIAHLLHQRGYDTPQAILDFIQRPSPLYDPFLIPDMESAVQRIHRAAHGHEAVTVYGDFDSDGLTASAIFLDCLRFLGLEPRIVIPTRDEGHGLRLERIHELHGKGTSLLITADCGITDLDGIACARQLGMDVIVTDHHQPLPDGRLPDALVVSPTRLDSVYPWKKLSGAGVAYKVAQALLPSPQVHEALLDLAAFGTIADVVDLRDENRTIVSLGLAKLRETGRCGLRALFSVAGVDRESLDGASVGYYLGPRINAANRIADPQIAFNLLTATDAAIAHRLASELDGHNSTRQEKVSQNLGTAMAEIGLPSEVKQLMRSGERDPLICISGDWLPGISGLIASDLVERYCVPALVASCQPDGTIVASGRSVHGVDILAILQTVAVARPGLFIRFGGHAAACGFTTEKESLGVAFSELGKAARGRVPIHELVTRLTVDAQVNLRQVDVHALEMVESLGPYGHGFEAPVFLATGVCLSSRSKVGANGRHLKMTARSGNGKVSAIIFNSDVELAEVPENQPLDIVFNLQRDNYGGFFRPQIHIKDWRLYEA